MPSSAELIETVDGWMLRLTIDEPLRAAVIRGLSEGRELNLRESELSVSVSPNLVPGDAFAISTLVLTAAEAEPPQADEEQPRRAEPSRR